MNYLLQNNIFLLIQILFLQLNALAPAQEPSFVQLNMEPEFSLASGDKQHILLSFLIKEGYHIQAFQVKDENVIPTLLSFDASDDFILGDPIFPEAVEFRIKGKEEALLVYSDVLEIYVPIRTVKSVEKGTFPINATLHYQACDDFKCYFPRNLHFIMKINIP
jgi:hypothetical protein